MVGLDTSELNGLGGSTGRKSPPLKNELFIAAFCLWREARNQSLPAKAAVFAVLKNRVADPRWPNTLWEVVLQPKQFSSFNADDPNAAKWPMPKNPQDWLAWLGAQAVVEAPLTSDPTMGANHYHDSSVPPPFKAWLGPGATEADLLKKLTLKLGSFSFYKL